MRQPTITRSTGRRSAALLVLVTAAVAPPLGTARTTAATPPPPGAAAPTTEAPPTEVPPTESPTTEVPDIRELTHAAPITSADPLPMVLPFPAAGAVEPRVVLGVIEIPVLGVSKPLMEGIALSTLDLGPGHMPGSAMPGSIGNVVVGGHRVSHDHPFLDIDRLVPGDEVIFRIGTERFTYLVEGTEIILPDELRVIEQRRQYTATLFACHPKGSTRERIIVHLRMAT